MMAENQIKANGARYLSEIPELAYGLPFGILNKKITDCGGTVAAMNSSSDYIIVVPFRGLADSIVGDENLSYEPLKVYGGINKDSFEDYIRYAEFHKIVVTYDSFPKVIEWIEFNGYPLDSYKVLIDEYHLIIEEMGYREKAINGLINNIHKFKHFTFMSATPIKDKFLSSWTAELPYTEIVWDSVPKVHVKNIGAKNVNKAVVRLIEVFKKGDLKLDINFQFIDYDRKDESIEERQVKELYVFINSVKGIVQIIKSAGLTTDDVKIVCSDTERNMKVLDGLPIRNITDPNAKINFFTKKAFQGCNIFTNNGLVVIVSDGNKQHTLLNIDTTIFQICGRIRANEKYNNVFRDRVWHIHSLYKRTLTYEEFSEDLQKKIDDSQKWISTFNSLDKSGKEMLIKRVSYKDLFCVYHEDNEEFYYSELKQKFFEYKYELLNLIYKNPETIQEASRNAGYIVDDNVEVLNSDDIFLKSVTGASFRQMIELYIKLRENEDENERRIQRLEREYPNFKEMYDKLGASGIKGCGYTKRRIKEKLSILNDGKLEDIHREFLCQVGEKEFISNGDAKEKLKEIYKSAGLVYETPTIKKLQNSNVFKVKKTQRRIYGKRTDGIILEQI